ncbi:MAG: prealbumin-like fold domain-containing protein [Dehalococcoidia bacterium]
MCLQLQGRAPTGTISGSKYQDLDGNGGNETTNPLSGWTFNLIDAGQNTVDSDTTVAGGSFSFANVTPGTYELCEVPQAGWTPTDPSTGCRTVVVTAGQDTVANFWNFQLQDITLTKTAETTWKRNNDWTIEKVVSDSDESEQASVTVNLNDGNSETVTWKVTATKTTTHSATVYGSVTITNPNPIALSVTTLTDVYDDTAVSFTDCSFPKSVPANDSVVCAYTIRPPPVRRICCQTAQTPSTPRGALRRPHRRRRRQRHRHLPALTTLATPTRSTSPTTILIPTLHGTTARRPSPRPTRSHSTAALSSTISRASRPTGSITPQRSPRPATTTAPQSW